MLKAFQGIDFSIFLFSFFLNLVQELKTPGFFVLSYYANCYLCGKQVDFFMSFKIVKRQSSSSSGGNPLVRRRGDVYNPISHFYPDEDALFRFGGRVRQFMEGAGEVANSDVPPLTEPYYNPPKFSVVPDNSSPEWEYVPDEGGQTTPVGGQSVAPVGSVTADVDMPEVNPSVGYGGQYDVNLGWTNVANAPYIQNGINAPDPSMPDLSGINNQMQRKSDEIQERDRTRFNNALDGDSMNPMPIPYYGGADLGSRAAMLGRSIGRAGNVSGGSRAANIAQGIFSGASLGLGLAREIAGAAASERARYKDTAAYRQRLANERRNSFIQYTESGGKVNIGNGQTFDTSDMTGEFLYPLPKSMNDVGNVEVEKGEYILRPDVTGPMEAKGHRHESGGTVVSLPEGTHVISDYRKITPDLVVYLADNYGIKSSIKDTYSDVLDKYKKKIGLKDLYDEQEKVYRRLQKAENIKDNNTSELSKSVLSGYISENQSKIDELEPRFRDFADMVYEAQEADKKKERIDEFFRDGGIVDSKKVSSYAKKTKISEDRAREIVYDNYRIMRKRMAEGGPTEEEMQWGRDAGDFLRQLFGRQLTFAPVMVEGTEAILNENTGEMANQGYQRGNSGMYGRATEESLGNLGNVNRWGRRYLDPNNLDIEGFQTDYNNQMNMAYALASSGAISNSRDMQEFRRHGFWGESAGKGNIGNPRSAQNSFAVDDKYGQTTATRPFYSLDVLTPEQRRLLNEKDIRNFVDLFGENADAAKKILGDDYSKFEQMRGRLNGMDFVLGEYTAPATPEAPDTVPIPTEGELGVTDFNPELKPIVNDNKDTGFRGYVGDSDPARIPSSGRGFGAGIVFPEIFREYPGGIITPGLERHQAPHIDPVLRSADQYINELNRSTSAQMDALGDVPDSQRAAILANLNSIAGTNIGRYINEVDYSNAQQRNYADRFNTVAYTQTDDKNIAERQRYEAGVLQAMAIDDENRARFWDSINDEVQKKWNVATSLNTIASIAPDMTMLPSGQIVYRGNNRFGYGAGDYSSAYLQAIDDMYNRGRGRTGSSSSNSRNGGMI